MTRFRVKKHCAGCYFVMVEDERIKSFTRYRLAQHYAYLRNTEERRREREEREMERHGLGTYPGDAY